VALIRKGKLIADTTVGVASPFMCDGNPATFAIGGMLSTDVADFDLAWGHGREAVCEKVVLKLTSPATYVDAVNGILTVEWWNGIAWGAVGLITTVSAGYHEYTVTDGSNAPLRIRVSFSDDDELNTWFAIHEIEFWYTASAAYHDGDSIAMP